MPRPKDRSLVFDKEQHGSSVDKVTELKTSEETVHYADKRTEAEKPTIHDVLKKMEELDILFENADFTEDDRSSIISRLKKRIQIMEKISVKKSDKLNVEEDIETDEAGTEPKEIRAIKLDQKIMEAIRRSSVICDTEESMEEEQLFSISNSRNQLPDIRKKIVPPESLHGDGDSHITVKPPEQYDIFFLSVDDDLGGVHDFVDTYLKKHQLKIFIWADRLLGGSFFRDFQEALENCTYTFLYVTKELCEDLLSQHAAYVAIWASIQDPEKKSSIVPIFKVPVETVPDPTLRNIYGFQLSKMDNNNIKRLDNLVLKRIDEKFTREEKLLSEYKQKIKEYTCQQDVFSPKSESDLYPGHSTVCIDDQGMMAAGRQSSVVCDAEGIESIQDDTEDELDKSMVYGNTLLTDN